MLSHWDNILGPRVVHVWNMGTGSLDSGFLSRISSQSLSGEICREVTSFIDHKLYEIPDADVFVTAFIFTAMGISGPCVHALSIVIQKSDMTFFLNIQQLFLKCFERIIRKFKVNLDQVIYSFLLFYAYDKCCISFEIYFYFHKCVHAIKMYVVLHVLWYLWKGWTFEKWVQPILGFIWLNIWKNLQGVWWLLSSLHWKHWIPEKVCLSSENCGMDLTFIAHKKTP